MKPHIYCIVEPAFCSRAYRVDRYKMKRMEKTSELTHLNRHSSVGPSPVP